MLIYIQPILILISIYRYARANNKYIRHYDKNKQWAYVQHWDVNLHVVGQCCNIFQYILLSESKIILNLMKIKKYNEKSNERYFLKLMFNILKNT